MKEAQNHSSGNFEGGRGGGGPGSRQHHNAGGDGDDSNHSIGLGAAKSHLSASPLQVCSETPNPKP